VTEQEYVRLAAACDRLLRAAGTSLARLAIPGLHVINEHPGSLAQYAPLTQQSYNLTHIPRAALRIARGLSRALTAATPALPLQTDVIIVSHLSNPAQLDQHDDFYFGALQTLLQERGVSSVLVLINHLPYEPANPSPRTRIVLPRAVSLATELGIWRQCVVASRRLRRETSDTEVAHFASREALSAATAINLRTHAILSALCRNLNPGIVITTYEGDAGERLIWHAARTAQRRPLCVGYQHARLLKHAHAVRRRIGDPRLDCDPDVILTLGEIPGRMLAASPEFGATRLIEYGSHRISLEPATDLPGPEDRPRQCVVLPDADEQECASLFKFAVATAGQRPDIRFVLRPHPIVDAAALLRRHAALQSLPNNVTLSAHSALSEDLSRARYCLYRSSSAAMLAVQAGIKPFYLARSGELPIDPLFELTSWRETVTSPDELNTRMSAADDTPDREAAARASDLYRHYSSAVRPAAIDELLTIARSAATDSPGC
jgi:hypothetical protein